MSRLIGENLKRKIILFFSNYLPLQTLKICYHDILKSITAGSFKLDQLIEDDKEINWRKFEKKLINFFRIISLCRFGL